MLIPHFACSQLSYKNTKRNKEVSINLLASNWLFVFPCGFLIHHNILIGVPTSEFEVQQQSSHWSLLSVFLPCWWSMSWLSSASVSCRALSSVGPSLCGFPAAPCDSPEPVAPGRGACRPPSRKAPTCTRHNPL